MKASLFTLVALLVFYVHADAYARCFERIAVYYAYQIDQLRPSDDRKIAVNCATARKIAKCNFIQLLVRHFLFLYYGLSYIRLNNIAFAISNPNCRHFHRSISMAETQEITMTLSRYSTIPTIMPSTFGL